MHATALKEACCTLVVDGCARKTVQQSHESELRALVRKATKIQHFQTSQRRAPKSYSSTQKEVLVYYGGGLQELWKRAPKSYGGGLQRTREAGSKELQRTREAGAQIKLVGSLDN